MNKAQSQLEAAGVVARHVILLVYFGLYIGSQVALGADPYSMGRGEQAVNPGCRRVMENWKTVMGKSWKSQLLLHI